jgi:hypothetical protein
LITQEWGFGQDFWGAREFRREGGGVILFWVRWGEEREEFNTEFTEGPQRTRRREFVALDRKNPPFIPQKARDGEEFAKEAKDGAPSSLFVG